MVTNTAHGPQVYVDRETCFLNSNIRVLSTDTFLLPFFKNKIYFSSDIDECSLESNNCDVNANCSNGLGNFTCTCKTGYSGDGQFCAGLYYILVLI